LDRVWSSGHNQGSTTEAYAIGKAAAETDATESSAEVSEAACNNNIFITFVTIIVYLFYV